MGEEHTSAKVTESRAQTPPPPAANLVRGRFRTQLGVGRGQSHVVREAGERCALSAAGSLLCGPVDASSRSAGSWRGVHRFAGCEMDARGLVWSYPLSLPPIPSVELLQGVFCALV